jgi:hypothetical protein
MPKQTDRKQKIGTVSKDRATQDLFPNWTILQQFIQLGLTLHWKLELVPVEVTHEAVSL